MDPSKQASVGKTWSAVASQAPSPSNEQPVPARPGARLTLKRPSPNKKAARPAPSSRANRKLIGQKVEAMTSGDIACGNMASGDTTSGEAKYEEKTQLREKCEPHTATNGLIDALNSTYRKETPEEKNEESNLASTNKEPRKNGLRNALEAVIGETAIRASPDKLDAASSSRHEFDPSIEKLRSEEPKVNMDAFESDLGPHGYERVIYPEIGWSTSRTWISGEEKERLRFEKIQTDLHRKDGGDSPFFPQTFKEFMKHQADIAAAKKRALEEDLQQLELDLERFRRVARYGKPPEQLNEPVQISLKLVSYSECDGLTVVGGRPSMWTNYYLHLGRVDWPTRHEFKAKRGKSGKKGSERFLPLPTIRVPDGRYDYIAFIPTPVLKTVPDALRARRLIDQFALNSVKYDSLSTYEAELLDEPTEEISMEDVPSETRQLIESIDAE